jgi:hypothetical protein
MEVWICLETTEFASRPCILCNQYPWDEEILVEDWTVKIGAFQPGERTAEVTGLCKRDGAEHRGIGATVRTAKLKKYVNGWLE